MTYIKNFVAIIIFSLVLFLTGCPETNSRIIVFVVDMSASIDPDGRSKAFESLAASFAQNKLKRGDKIILIPVTGDAWSESQGMIQRFTISEEREAYDADLTRLEDGVRQKLEVMQRSAAEKPFQKTDLFGALKLASAEIQREGRNRKKIVIVLSDMIQDDSTANFKTASYLQNKRAAVAEAASFVDGQTTNYKGCNIFLGFLRSSDLTALKIRRREALEAFWKEYFRVADAAEIVSAVDGPGQIDSILSED